MFADLEKCFDKLWLKDCLNDMRKTGMDLADLELVRKMNAEAKITVDTQHGRALLFTATDVVRQGTMYRPPLWGG